MILFNKFLIQQINKVFYSTNSCGKKLVYELFGMRFQMTFPIKICCRKILTGFLLVQVSLKKCYTNRSLFEILLNKTEIRLYLPFFDWFGTKWTSVWIQINRKMVNTIWFRVDLIRFRKKILCVWSQTTSKTVR